jgi:glutamate-5-semialdehyde dehydrogenase
MIKKEGYKMTNYIESMLIKAYQASKILAVSDSQTKNNILSAMREGLSQKIDEILFHNEIDIAVAKESGLSQSMIDRLALDKKRIGDILAGIDKIISLDDPIGENIETLKSPFDIDIRKVRVPLGVIAMIYEARPGVTVDSAALCLKSGNAIILRGGSEAINSNRILIKIISQAAMQSGLPQGSIGFINNLDKSLVSELITFDKYVDLIIPRGGQALVDFIRANSKIPVLSHGKGLCHLYIDKYADIDMALKIAVNAKCQRPSVCNTIETLLVHNDIAKDFLPKIYKLYSENGVEIRGCDLTKSILASIKSASEQDWDSEYNDLIISIKIVKSQGEAVEHINKYGSKHSDAIITQNQDLSNKFIREVDSAAVFVNASTRLHDGSVFGLGGEIGISTQKLHSRGAMSLKDLTTTKFIVKGNGTIRE